MKFKGLKGLKATVLAAALVGIMTVGGISAYFTDADTVTNEFTIGKVSIDLVEPDWGGNPEENVTPLQEITKNPKVTNDGINDAFIFMTITVPYANVITANADGTRNEAADTELFYYTVNTGWEELSKTKDTTNKTVTHLYAYSAGNTMTALKKDITTVALFDKVTVANVIEDQGLECTEQDIVVSAYAIQTNNINGGTTKASNVWSVIANQNPSTLVEQLEDAITDAKK